MKTAVFLGSLSVIPLLFPGVAHADQLSSAKAQAATISAKITQLNNQIAQLSEQYDQAQTQLSQIDSQVSQTKASIARQKQHVIALKHKMVSEAVTAFTQAGTGSNFVSILQGSATDVSISQEYMNSVSTSQQDLILSYQNAQAQLQSQQAKLGVEQSQATSTLNQINNLKSQAQSSINYEQSALNNQNSTIATLVLQAQQAAIAAQQANAARLAAAAAAQASQAQAAQAAQRSTQNTPATTQVSATPAPPVVSSLGGGSISNMLATAYAQLGKPYAFGGAGPSAFDCSGLVMYAYQSIGISLPHNAAAQYSDTTRISQSQLQPGDLVFYEPGGSGYIDHVAIYVGGGRVLEADTYGIPVEIDSMYFVGNPVGYGRVQ